VVSEGQFPAGAAADAIELVIQARSYLRTEEVPLSPSGPKGHFFWLWAVRLKPYPSQDDS
jgi:hypothetical protein